MDAVQAEASEQSAAAAWSGAAAEVYRQLPVYV